MSHNGRAVRTLFVVGALMVPLVAASIAFACARLATLKLNRAGATEGATVTAVGRNFSNSPQASPVSLRFNSRTGQVLWEGRADRLGNIRAQFRVPDARAGHYVVLATQTTAEGRPAAGTPGRAPLRLRGSTKDAVVVPVAGDPGGGLPALPAPAAPLLALVAAGALTGVVAARRRRPAPAG